MKKEWINLLHRSFEEELSKAETIQLETALKESEELRLEQAELRATRNLFATFSVEKDDNFVAAIMAAVEKEELVAKRQIAHYLSRIFPISIAACVFILMSFVGHIYISEGNFESESIVGVSDLAPEDAYSYLLDE